MDTEFIFFLFAWSNLYSIMDDGISQTTYIFMRYLVKFFLCPSYIANFTEAATVQPTLVIPDKLHLLLWVGPNESLHI